MNVNGCPNFRQWPFRVLNGCVKAIFFVLIALVPIMAEAASGPASRCESVYRNFANLQPNPAEMIGQFAARYGIDLENPEYSVKERPFVLPGILLPDVYKLGRSYYLQTDHVQFLSPQATTEIAAMPAVRTKPVLGDSVTRHPELRGEIWQLPTGESFHWMNVGSSLLMEDGDSAVFPQAAADLAKQYPGQPLRIEVPYNPSWLQARDALLKRQKLTSIKITNRYEQEKPYLNPEQLYGLREYDTEEPNANDYFILLDETSQSPLLMTADQFKAHTVASLRLARLEHRSSMDRGILLGPESLRNQLPHASRVHGKLSGQLQNLLWRLTTEKNLHVTEITRVNRFGKVPKAAMRSLFHKALQSAKNPKKPTDIFVLECDATVLPAANGSSSRSLVDYYREEYGFEILVQVNDPESSGPAEYLMYLDTRSERYGQVMAKLNAETAELKTQPAPELPPVETWTHHWDLQNDYLAHSPVVRLRKWLLAIQSKFTEFKKQSLVNLSSEQIDVPENFSFEELGAFLKNLNVRSIESSLALLKSSATSATAVSQLRELLNLRQVGFSFPMTAKILVLGENASVHAQFLKESENRWQVETQWPRDHEEKFDHVILSFVLSQSDPTARASFLQRASQLLKPGGELVILDNITKPATGDTDVSLPSEALAQAKASASMLAMSVMPLTKSQIIATVALEYGQNRQRKPLAFQVIESELQTAGFSTTSWSRSGTILRFRKSH